MAGKPRIGLQSQGAPDGVAGLRPMHQGEPRLQPARRARRDLGDGAAKLHPARPRPRQGLRRSLDPHRSGQGGLMPDLLLELFSEEIPARMQAKAADDLRRMVTDKLVAEGLVYEDAKIQPDPRKGDFYIALIEKPGRATIDVLAEILPVIIRTFPWPKSMRWGARSGKPGSLSWG